MADEDLKSLLKQNIEVSEESLKILKKMNRARIIGGIFIFIKWVVIIGASVGAYYVVEPILKTMLDSYQSLLTGVDQVKDAGQAVGEVPTDLIEKLRGLFGN